MFKIRPEQLEAFEPVADAAFVVRVVQHLRDEHADEVVSLPDREYTVAGLDEETIAEMARTGIAKARSYGFTWESSITAFVVLMFVVAPSFDNHPLIKRALNDTSPDENSRIENLFERTSSENWDVAAQSYDSAAWFG
jgi:hypothetical protein